MSKMMPPKIITGRCTVRWPRLPSGPCWPPTRPDGSRELFTFNQPLFLDAEVWGRLYDDDSIGARGHLALTNFTIRGEMVGQR